MKKIKWSLKNFKRGITLSLFLSIVPVLLFGSMIYRFGTDMVQTEVQRTSQERLIFLRKQVDGMLSQLEQMTNQMALQSDIIQWINIGQAPALGTLTLSNTVMQNLSNLKNNYQYIDSAYLYHISQHVIATPAVITSAGDLRMLKDNGWLPLMNQMVENKRQSQWVAPRSMVNESIEPATTVTYLRILPFFYNDAKAAIIVNIRGDFLNFMLTGAPFGERAGVMIFNNENKLIASKGWNTEPSDNALNAVEQWLAKLPATSYSEEGITTAKLQGQFVSVNKSAANGWKYVMMVPGDMPIRKVELFKRMVMVLTLCLGLLAVISAFFSYKRFQQNLKKIIDRLKGVNLVKDNALEKDRVQYQQEFRNPLDQIEYRISLLASEADEVQRKWQQQIPYIRDHFIFTCIYGNPALIRDSQWLENSPLFPNPLLQVLVVEMDPPLEGEQERFKENDSLFLFSVANIAKELVQPPGHSEVLMTYNQVVLILNPELNTSEHEALHFAESLRSMVRKYLKHTVTIGVGRPVRHEQELNLSFQDALSRLQTNWLQSRDQVVSYLQPLGYKDGFKVYPIFLENELVTALRMQDEVVVFRKLAEFRTFLEDGHTPISLVRTYSLQLVVSIFRLLQEYEEDITTLFRENNPYEQFLQLDSTDKTFDWISRELLRPLLDFFRHMRMKKKQDAANQALEMIERRFADPSLSLQALADELKLSASQLSLIFKEQTGMTFVHYVTERRLNEAKRLLARTELYLSDIALEVGYSNATQLIRVFKKANGMTPGEYRASEKS